MQLQAAHGLHLALPIFANAQMWPHAPKPATPRGRQPNKKHRCKSTFFGRDCRAPLRAVPPLRMMATFFVMIDLFDSLKRLSR